MLRNHAPSHWPFSPLCALLPDGAHFRRIRMLRGFKTDKTLIAAHNESSCSITDEHAVKHTARRQMYQLQWSRVMASVAELLIQGSQYWFKLKRDALKALGQVQWSSSHSPSACLLVLGFLFTYCGPAEAIHHCSKHLKSPFLPAETYFRES